MADKIGILPGTFDPVHDGHIGFCLEAIETCKLDKVYLLPEARPFRKPKASSIAERLVQVNNKVAVYRQIDFITLQSQKFTVQHTLPELQQQLNGAELTLLVGSDIAFILHTWPGVGRLLRGMALAVGIRGRDTPQAAGDYLQNLYSDFDLPCNYTVLQSPHPHVSSTLIRRQALA